MAEISNLLSHFNAICHNICVKPAEGYDLFTLGSRGFSCAVSGFGQVLKSDPREKPLDQSAIPLIAPSQLRPRLYQNIQNLDVLLIGSLEISNVSYALIGLQSQ